MAGGKGNTFINDLLKLIFNAANIALLADNTATTPLTVLYLSLHTASPGAAGNQSTNEAAYTGYTRVTVNRNSGGWTVTSQSVSPTNDVNFPTATAGSETETFVGIGTAVSGAGKLLWFGSLNPSIAVAAGVPPVITQGSTITEA